MFAWAAVAWEHDPGLGTPEEGSYHAYVVPYSPDAPTPLGSGVPVGDVAISLEFSDRGGVRFGPHHATLTFTMPNLPPGEYQLTHANAAGTYVGDLLASRPFRIDAPVLRATPSFTG